jgi:hypothetical protein
MTKHLLLALTVAACTHGTGLENQPDATRTFSPATITLQRYATECGVQDPAFEDSDLYSMTLLGSAAGDQHPTMLQVTFHRTLPLNQALAVDLLPFGVVSSTIDSNGTETDFFGQDGTLPLTDNSFTWSQGTNAAEVDDQPISEATVTFEGMPAGEGDAGALTIRMVFSDGGIYDTQVSAALFTGLEGCPAG